MLTLQHLPFAAQLHPEARSAQRLTWDSREAGPGVAFVALDGEKMHGNQFIAQALKQGAPFILTDLDVPRAVRVPPVAGGTGARAALYAWARSERAKNPLVVGITGSAGKTTAKSYAAAALEAHYMPVFNTLGAIACFLLEYGASPRPLVIEMGIDRLGEMQELVELVRPDIGVLTSIGPTHLEQLGSVENVAREKGIILQSGQGFVSQQAAAWFPGQPTYGFEGATYAGEGLRITPQAATFSYHGVPLTLPHASRVQAEAAVLGLALAERAGLDLQQAVSRLERVQVPAGRYQVLPGRFTIIDDTYNASPVAVGAALEALSHFEGRKVSVLGHMLELGAGEQALHAQVGQAARAQADLTYGVGQFARELGEYAFADNHSLLAALKETLTDGDVVLLKASRGISMTPEQRAQAGVGLDSVVRELQKWRDHTGQGQTQREEA